MASYLDEKTLLSLGTIDPELEAVSCALWTPVIIS